MLGTVPSSLVFCGGLESEIQTAGLKEKTEEKGGCGARWAGKHLPSLCIGSREGVVTLAGTNLETQFQFPDHCQHQGSISKARELEKAEKNKINEHSRRWGVAVLGRCSFYPCWARQGLSL